MTMKKSKWILDSIYERTEHYGFVCVKKCSQRRKPIEAPVYLDISLISSFSPIIQLRLDNYISNAMFYLVMADICSSYQCINKVSIKRTYRKNGLRDTTVRMRVYRMRR